MHRSGHSSSERIPRWEIEALPTEEDTVASSGRNGIGRSPLSARLAAFAGSLALERRLKQVEGATAGDSSRGYGWWKEEQDPVDMGF